MSEIFGLWILSKKNKNKKAKKEVIEVEADKMQWQKNEEGNHEPKNVENLQCLEKSRKWILC